MCKRTGAQGAKRRRATVRRHAKLGDEFFICRRRRRASVASDYNIMLAAGVPVKAVTRYLLPVTRQAAKMLQYAAHSLFPVFSHTNVTKKAETK